MAQAGLSPQKREFDPRPVHVEFTMDSVILGQIFLLVLRMSAVSISFSFSFILIHVVTYATLDLSICVLQNL